MPVELLASAPSREYEPPLRASLGALFHLLGASRGLAALDFERDFYCLPCIHGDFLSGIDPCSGGGPICSGFPPFERRNSETAGTNAQLVPSGLHAPQHLAPTPG